MTFKDQDDLSYANLDQIEIIHFQINASLIFCFYFLYKPNISNLTSKDDDDLSIDSFTTADSELSLSDSLIFKMDTDSGAEEQMRKK